MRGALYIIRVWVYGRRACVVVVVSRSLRQPVMVIGSGDRGACHGAVPLSASCPSSLVGAFTARPSTMVCVCPMSSEYRRRVRRPTRGSRRGDRPLLHEQVWLVRERQRQELGRVRASRRSDSLPCLVPRCSPHCPLYPVFRGTARTRALARVPRRWGLDWSQASRESGAAVHPPTCGGAAPARAVEAPNC